MLPFPSFSLSVFFLFFPSPLPSLTLSPVFRYYIERRADRPHGYCAGIKLKLRSRTARGGGKKFRPPAEAACRKIPGRRTQRMGIPIEAATGGSRDGKHNLPLHFPPFVVPADAKSAQRGCIGAVRVHPQGNGNFWSIESYVEDNFKLEYYFYFNMLINADTTIFFTVKNKKKTSKDMNSRLFLPCKEIGIFGEYCYVEDTFLCWKLKF